jgi:hypothetical protein
MPAEEHTPRDPRQWLARLTPLQVPLEGLAVVGCGRQLVGLLVGGDTPGGTKPRLDDVQCQVGASPLSKAPAVWRSMQVMSK